MNVGEATLTKKILGFGILWVIFLLYACTDDGLSKEEEIKQFIEAGIEAAENRSARDLSKLIDENYLDDRKFNKKQLTTLVQVYFFRHKNIFLFTKIDEIEFFTDNEALVTLYVAMAGSVISSTNVLTSLRAKTYKFELELIKQDKWLLQRAKWQSISVSDMQ